MESCPTISVEKTDGCQMYLSKGLTPEIITAKSSEMNVIIPTDNDDYVSKITKVKNRMLSSPYNLTQYSLFFYCLINDSIF